MIELTLVPNSNSNQDPQSSDSLSNSNQVLASQASAFNTTTTSTAIDVNEGPKKSKKKKVFLIIGLIILLVSAALGWMLYIGIRDASEVTQLGDSFLSAYSENNLSTAYQLTSNEFQKTVPFEDFETMRSISRAQFSDYQSLEQTGFNVQSEVGRPTTYQLFGIVTYINNDEGEAEITFVKENGLWKINSANISVSLERLEQFEQNQENSVLGVHTISQE